MGDDDFDDDLELEDSDFEKLSQAPPKQRESSLACRRRIEDLKELRRIRELVEDDDFTLEFD